MSSVALPESGGYRACRLASGNPGPEGREWRSTLFFEIKINPSVFQFGKGTGEDLRYIHDR